MKGCWDDTQAQGCWECSEACRGARITLRNALVLGIPPLLQWCWDDPHIYTVAGITPTFRFAGMTTCIHWCWNDPLTSSSACSGPGMTHAYSGPVITHAHVIIHALVWGRKTHALMLG